MKYSSRNTLPTVGLNISWHLQLTLGCKTRRPEIIRIYHFSGARRLAGGVFCSRRARLRLDGLHGLTNTPGALSLGLLISQGASPSVFTGRQKGPGNQRAPAPPHRAFQASACLAAAPGPLAKAPHRVRGEELPQGVALGRQSSSEAISAATCHK